MPTLQPVSPDFLDSAPFRIVTDVTVMAPIAHCWTLLADQASWVQWFSGMSSVEATPWTWTEPGQKRIVNVNGLKVHETAISVDHEREYAFMIDKWPLRNARRAAEGVRLEDRTNGGAPRTRLTYIGAFESTAIGRKLESILEKQLGNAWGTALKELGALADRKATANA